MSTFTIDFFELAFLAEACIPPRPIARAMFWQDLTRKYWHQMTEGERAHLFEWMNKNEWYKESLENEEDTQVFHSRYNPDNQYMIKTRHKNEKKRWVKGEHRAFKFDDRYWVGLNTFIPEENITEINKFTPKREY
jgi:hypothetical protein